MGNFIVIFILALMVYGAVRALRKESRESGSCAFCSYAKGGKCHHVGHQELDPEGRRLQLTKEQQAILDRHTRVRS